MLMLSSETLMKSSSLSMGMEGGDFDTAGSQLFTLEMYSFN